MSVEDDDDLGTSVDRALFRRAEKNELTLAWMRSCTMTPFAILQTLAYFEIFPPAQPVPIAVPINVVTGTAIAWALTVHLRRGGYRRWMQIVVPVAEGAFLALSFTMSVRAGDFETFRASGTITVLGLVAAIFALSGALRLNRSSVALTTGIAVALFGSYAFQLLPPAIAILSTCVLLTFGAFGLVLTRVVGDALRSEIARLTLKRFLPSSVVDGAHEDPRRLLTEPKSVDATIVFTDIRGFTSWSESRPPAEVLSSLNDLQGALAAEVRKHGGTVDKFMGDGMLAVFGAPEPLADHATRALAAVEGIRQTMKTLDQFKIGIGVHSGEVVVGCLGKGLRLEFTVIGDTVNTASRLEGMTKTYATDVLLSASFVERLDPRPPLVSIGNVEIRGRKEPLGLYAFEEDGKKPGRE